MNFPEIQNEIKNAFMELWPLYIFSFGMAYLFRRRVKSSYKGRSRLDRFFNDILNSICNGTISVSAAIILSTFWPQLDSVKMQICMIGFLSGYGLSFIHRLVAHKLGLTQTEVNDILDIEDAKKYIKKESKTKESE